MTDRITIERLREVLRYVPETGELFWLERAQSPRWKGWVNGRRALHNLTSNGYRRGVVDGVFIGAHRVAFAIYHGRWPLGQIDHINGNRADNRIANLRDVTRSVNLKNTKLRSDNISGHPGVSWHAGTRKWCATVMSGDRRVHLGLFETIPAAVEARRKAQIGQGYHENHGRAA